MVNTGTLRDLLDLAIRAEHNAEVLYDGLNRAFQEHPDVAEFWTKYAREEAGHARWMENLKERTDPARLITPAEQELLDLARRVTNVSPEAYLERVNNLQDAWELANELEHGETNVIFDFLIQSFSSDEQAVTFLRSQLRDHVDHLLQNFPAQYSMVEIRQAVRAKKS